MADEDRTLLKFEGDASGAKKAAQEQQAAIGEVAAKVQELRGVEGQAAQASQEASESAAAAARAAADSGATAAKELSSATNQAGTSFMLAGQEASSFGQIISMIDPRLGQLVSAGGQLDTVFSAAFSPAGLMTGGLVAALGAVAAIVKYIQESIEKAERDLVDMEAAKARLAKDKLEAEGEIGKALAAHGTGSEGALDRAREEAAKLEAEGFERSTAVRTAAAAQAAGVSMSDEDRRRLAMGLQLGAVDVGGRTPAETQASIAEAMDKLAIMGPDLQRALEGAIAQTMRGANLGAMREAAQGTEGFLEDALRKLDPKLGDEAIAEQAEKVRKSLEGAPVEIRNISAGLGFAKQTSSSVEDYNEGRKLLEQLNQQIKAKEEQIEGQRERVRRIAIREAAEATPKAWSETFGEQPQAPDDPAQQAEQQRRDRLAGVLARLETGARKATLSPEEYLRGELEALGATPEQIGQALELQRQASGTPRESAPRSRSARPQMGAPTPFDPDAQNRGTTVNNYYSGHVVLADAEPWKKMRPRSPVQ